MLKQRIAQLFCFLTIVLLSSNIALSAVPFSSSHKHKSETERTSYFSYSDVHDEAGFVTEKDPFEELLDVFLAPDSICISYQFSSNFVQSLSIVARSGATHVHVPIWLLFCRIIQ